MAIGSGVTPSTGAFPLPTTLLFCLYLPTFKDHTDGAKQPASLPWEKASHISTHFSKVKRPPAKMDDAKGLAIAFEEAQLSYSEGGIPVRLDGEGASEHPKYPT